MSLLTASFVGGADIDRWLLDEEAAVAAEPFVAFSERPAAAAAAAQNAAAARQPKPKSANDDDDDDDEDFDEDSVERRLLV